MVYVRLPDACVLTVQPGRQRERRAEAVPRWPFEAGDLQGEPLPQSLFTVDLGDRRSRRVRRARPARPRGGRPPRPRSRRPPPGAVAPGTGPDRPRRGRRSAVAPRPTVAAAAGRSRGPHATPLRRAARRRTNGTP